MAWGCGLVRRPYLIPAPDESLFEFNESNVPGTRFDLCEKKYRITENYSAFKDNREFHFQFHILQRTRLTYKPDGDRAAELGPSHSSVTRTAVGSSIAPASDSAHDRLLPQQSHPNPQEALWAMKAGNGTVWNL